MNDPVVLTVGDARYPLRAGESVLDGMLRHGLPIDSSCRSGQCRACMIQGEPAPDGSQRGLTQNLIEQGYFLACQAKPAQDVAIRGGPAPHVAAVVIGHDAIGQGVVRVRLKPTGAFAYRPGQFIHVSAPGGVIRSYSLASVTTEGFLELHVRRVDGGRVSCWIYDDLRVGDTVRVQGPQGDCFYAAGREDQPLICAGAGTGLAPLYGIVRDALARGHRGPIQLIQGARLPERLYLVEALRDLARSHETLTLHLCAPDGDAIGVERAPLDAYTLRIAKELLGAGHPKPRVFLCGNAAIVRAMRRGLFLAGVPSQDIFADPFTQAAPAS